MLRRALLPLLLTALLAPASASAAQLSITRADGGQATAALDALPTAARTVEGPGGSVEVTGVLLGAALRSGDLQPFELETLTVSAPDGTSLTLARDAAFADDGPVLVVDGTALRLVGGGRELVAPDGTLAVVATDDDSAITVTASARPTRVEEGDPVTFTASSPTAGVTFRWQFRDGTSGRGARVVHRYRKEGRYVVVVGATTADDLAGDAAVVTVQVGDPKPEAPATATATPTAIPAAGSGVPSGTGVSGPGAGGSGGSSTGGGTTGGPGAAAPSSPGATSATPTPGPTATATPRPDASPTPEPTGDPVSGEVLDDTVLTAAAITLPGDDDGGSPGGSGGVDIPAGVWGLAAALLAGFLGFRLDMARSRPRWTA